MLNHKTKKCPECMGAGVKRNYAAGRVRRPPCKVCNGTGKVKADAKP